MGGKGELPARSRQDVGFERWTHPGGAAGFGPGPLRQHGPEAMGRARAGRAGRRKTRDPRRSNGASLRMASRLCDPASSMASRRPSAFGSPPGRRAGCRTISLPPQGQTARSGKAMPSSRTHGVTVLFVLSLCLLAAPAGSDQPPQAPCPRPAPRAFDPGEVVEIPDTEAPCRLEVRETEGPASRGGGRLETRPGYPGPARWAGPLLFDGRVRFWNHHHALGRPGEVPRVVRTRRGGPGRAQ